MKTHLHKEESMTNENTFTQMLHPGIMGIPTLGQINAPYD